MLYLENMKSKVLVITGACGVGKSTISTLWAKENAGVSVECDYFTEWIHDRHPVETDYFLKTEEMVANLSLAVAKEYMRNGFSVALENVWTPQGLNILRKGFEKEKSIESLTFVWLKCGLGTNLKRDLLREPGSQMKKRVEIVSSELAAYDWPDFVKVIDTTDLSVQETLRMVVDYTPNP